MRCRRSSCRGSSQRLGLSHDAAHVCVSRTGLIEPLDGRNMARARPLVDWELADRTGFWLLPDLRTVEWNLPELYVVFAQHCVDAAPQVRVTLGVGEIRPPLVEACDHRGHQVRCD